MEDGGWIGAGGGFLSILHPRSSLLHLPLWNHGIRHHLDRLVDVIEDDQLAVEAEQELGQLAIIERRLCELFALVIANGVVAGVADQAAGERRQRRPAVEARR